MNYSTLKAKITLKKASEMAEKEKTEQQALEFIEQNFDAYFDTTMDLFEEQGKCEEK